MIYFFYGDDTWSLFRELQKLKEKFLKSDPQAAVEELDLASFATETAFLEKLQEALRSQGLFASKKLLTIRGFLGTAKKYTTAAEYLAFALESLPSSLTLVFLETEGVDMRLGWFKKLLKLAKAREFSVPTDAKLQSWIKKYVAESEFEIEPGALSRFIRLIQGEDWEAQYDLWVVSSELEKLMLYRKSEKLIRAEDVVALVKPKLSQNIFALTNLFAEGQTEEALLQLEKLAGSGPVAEMKTQAIQIIGALASQIRALLLVKDVQDEEPAEVARILGWKEGRVWIMRRLATKFTSEKLSGMLRDLRAIDLRLKTSEESPKLLLALFFQKAAA